MRANVPVRSGFRRIRPIISYAAAHLDGDLSLAALGAHARLSPFHLHRLFSAVVGETPKEFTARLRLERAAAMLLTSSMPVLGVALTCGFRSHETFTRTFGQRFGMTPTAYRRRGLSGDARSGLRTQHGRWVAQTGRCLGLYRTSINAFSGGSQMKYSIVEKALAPQPVLVARRRVKRSEIAKALGELLGAVFMHAQRAGAAIVGQPFTRYLSWGPALVSIESGLPVAIPVAGEGNVLAEMLPGGRAAVTTHSGSYEQLIDAHMAVELWIEENAHRAAGAPWEVYVTDPTDHPDPKDWRTDVFWPIAS